MANKIQVRRGTKAQLTALGALALGEPGYATDTGELYIGNGSGANTKVSASETERTTWNAKASTALATTSASGLMSAADKTKTDKAVTAVSAAITLYVNNSTGVDTNNGTSTATPLKTRAAALAKIDPVLNADVTIIMMTGEGGTLTISGFLGNGKLTVKGQTTTATSYAINAVVIKNCSCSVSIENMAIFNSGGPNIDVSGCADVYIGNVSIPQANTGAGIQAAASNLTIASCAISNQTYGIVSNRSIIYSYNNTGSGNTLALVADQTGTIGKGGTQPSGTTAELQQNGGVIR